MILTPEEELMYKVMMAIYKSGIPIDFKGAMVLKACLLEAGFSAQIRHTMDIDANWYSETDPTAEEMTDSLRNALQKNGIDLEIKLYRMYGEGRSAGFELILPESGEAVFSMDIDVNRPVQPTKIYCMSGLRFRGISPVQMLADKISAISTEKVFRRIKDIIDLYYLSTVFELDKNDLLQTMVNSGRIMGSFDGFLYSTNELRHAYEKFRFDGNVNKPDFDEVYQAVKTYIECVLPTINES